MGRVSPRWLAAAGVLLLGGTLCLTLLIETWYEGSKIDKIDRVIQDNQHQNYGGLPRAMMTSYLLACGARVDASMVAWNVRYDGRFRHQSWTFSYVEPLQRDSR